MRRLGAWVFLVVSVGAVPAGALEALFNKPPFADPVEERLVALVGAVPAGGKLELCQYQFGRPAVVQAVTNAARRGVRVRLVVEKDNVNVHVARLAAMPNATVVTEDRSSLMHNKFILFDQGGSSAVADTVWTGSMNLTTDGMTKDAQNVVVFQDAAVAALFAAEFRQMWSNRLFGTTKTAVPPPPPRVYTVAGRTVEVWFSPKDGAGQRLRQLVDAATASVCFNIFTFTTNAGVVRALTNAARRGVKVTGVFDAFSGGNYGAAGAFTVLSQANLPVFRDRVDGQPPSLQYLLHHKFMVIDAETSSPVVVTGSFNWTAAADNQNDENMLVIRGDRCLAWRFLQEARVRTEEAGGVFVLPYRPPAVAGLQAVSVPEGLRVSWGVPDACGLDRLVVRWSTVSAPTNPSDGMGGATALPGQGSVVFAPAVEPGTTLHLSVFLVDVLGTSSPRASVTAVYRGGTEDIAVLDNDIGPEDRELTVAPPSSGFWRSVRVYDLSGRLVRALPVGGTVWDLRDDMGVPVGSGTYFVVCRSGDRVVKNRVRVRR